MILRFNSADSFDFNDVIIGRIRLIINFEEEPNLVTEAKFYNP
jgi:hypothetical protein